MHMQHPSSCRYVSSWNVHMSREVSHMVLQGDMLAVALQVLDLAQAFLVRHWTLGLNADI